MKNFVRPEGEKPYYYSTTVENGEIVRHDFDEAHAVYKSEMEETTRRANLWHKWVEENVPNAYSEDGLGILKPEVMAVYRDWETDRKSVV